MVWFAEDTDLKNSKDPSDILDPTPPNDFSFADSLLDFDSIQQWFEDKSSSDKPNVLHATNPSSFQISESEDLVTSSGDAIEDGMAKISLSVAIPSEVMPNDGESSSSSSSTSSGSDSDSDSEQEQHPEMKGDGKTQQYTHEELEEGEIRDSATLDNVDDDDDDYGDGDASGTPIRSKNELEVLLF